MNPVVTQQVALDNALVAPKNRLKIKRCNARIEFSKPQREETYQVTFDALKLSSCYLAFHITFEVPKIYMHQFWNTIMKIRKSDAYNFKLDKKKCRVDTKDIKNFKTYKTCFDFATGKVPPNKARKFENDASPKLTIVRASSKVPIKKSKRVKRPAKKFTTASTSGVVIRDTSIVSVLKKKEPDKADRGKGNEKETHKLQASGSCEGADFESEVPYESKAKPSDTSEGTDKKPGVLDVSKVDSFNSDDVSWGNSKDESDDVNDKDDNDDESGNGNDGEYDDLYKDVKGDAKMIDATRESGSQENSYEQVIEDAHVTLTTSQKTKRTKQSSFVSSDFESKFLNLDNLPPVINEVAFMMNVKVRQEESSTQALPLLLVLVTAILETSTNRSSKQSL
nr:hypothetical protein [Tanacetum cinerariifolium]